MTKQSVSVVIPYFNGMGSIERAIDSVLTQTMPAAEIVVVNDGSTERDSVFLHELAERKKFRVIETENQGQSAARNLGIDSAVNEWICLLDQDDIFLPTHIERLADAARKYSGDMLGFVYSDVARATESDQITDSGILATAGKTHPMTNVADMIAADMMILPSATLIVRSAFRSIGGFDATLSGFEDDDLFVRFVTGGFDVEFVPESLAVWTLNPASASFSPSMARSRWRLFTKYIAAFPDSSPHGTMLVRDAIAPRFIRSFIGDYLYNLGADESTVAEKRTRLREAATALAQSGRQYDPLHVALPRLIAAAPRPLLALAFALFERLRGSSRSPR